MAGWTGSILQTCIILYIWISVTTISRDQSHQALVLLPSSLTWICLPMTCKDLSQRPYVIVLNKPPSISLTTIYFYHAYYSKNTREFNEPLHFFADLPHLVSLDLSSNSLWGVIPSSIGALAKLALLDLSFNLLDGPIPPSIGSCTKLTSLDLSHNILSKRSIRSIGNLMSLRYLDLSNNQINGSFPSPFWN